MSRRPLVVVFFFFFFFFFITKQAVRQGKAAVGYKSRVSIHRRMVVRPDHGM
jgi:hypothetical protein